jgi:hypothetical protein
MKLVACFLATALLPCVADDLSGPNHSTLRRTSWGTFFYDPVAMGPHQFESTVEEFRIKSRTGEVRLVGSDINGYRLTCGADLLTVRMTNGDLEIRWQEKVWTWRSQNSAYTLTSTVPKDSIQFERNANAINIKGSQGSASIYWNPGTLTIKSSAGTVTVTNYLGNRAFSGIGLDQVPYLGRGVFISFHGLGLLIDVQKLFAMPEVAEWNEWKPILGRPFDPNAN